MMTDRRCGRTRRLPGIVGKGPLGQLERDRQVLGQGVAPDLRRRLEFTDVAVEPGRDVRGDVVGQLEVEGPPSP